MWLLIPVADFKFWDLADLRKTISLPTLVRPRSFRLPFKNFCPGKLISRDSKRCAACPTMSHRRPFSHGFM